MALKSNRATEEKPGKEEIEACGEGLAYRKREERVGTQTQRGGNIERRNLTDSGTER